MHHSQIQPPRARTARKLASALLIFGTTFAVVEQVRPLVVSRQPLPGDPGTTGPCAIWFIGSSTFARWSKLGEDMAPWRIANRGVGGALIGELAQRFVIEQGGAAPGALVVYAGDNDLAAGQSADEVASSLTGLVATIRARMPDARLVVLAPKPSPARWSLRDEQLRLDRLMRGELAGVPLVTFADAGASLLVGGEPGPFYDDDGVHLNSDGYRAWGGAVRDAVESAEPSSRVANCAASRMTAA